MPSCQCEGIEKLFNPRMVKSELKTFRRRGPAKTTRLLIAALEARGVNGARVLDIGGGLGAIQYALLSAGASSATDVDASPAYLAVAQEEAARRGVLDRITYHAGNFVDIAAEVPDAEIVTLDKVLCCYDDARSLARLSAQHATRLVGVVYPRDTWWSRWFAGTFNAGLHLFRQSYSFFVHSTRDIERQLREAGFAREYYQTAGLWQVVVFARHA